MQSYETKAWCQQNYNSRYGYTLHECFISERYRSGTVFWERGYLSVADACQFYEQYEELGLLKLTQHIWQWLEVINSYCMVN